MGGSRRGRYAPVSRKGIDRALQIFGLRKLPANYKAIVTGGAYNIQNLRYRLEQRDIPLNVLMRGTHPYDGLKAKAYNP
jgi:hypothetical protein